MLFIHSLFFYGMGEGRWAGEVEGSGGYYVVEREGERKKERIGGMSGGR